MNGLIMTGLQRLQSFAHDDGRFSLWDGSMPSLDVTRKVAHRLLAFNGLPYPAALEMLARSSEALLKDKVKDNQLLPLDNRFRGRLDSVEDAVALYFHGQEVQDKPRSLAYLKQVAEQSDGIAHWPAREAWGGAVETTCDATRVMHAAGDPLFRAGFAYVGQRLVDGRLYSTADTRALVELLASLSTSGRRALIDSVEQRPEQPVVATQVQALENGVVARVDKDEIIDYLEPRAGFNFGVSMGKTHLRVGERTQITIDLREESLCPLARIYLPGTLALLKGGANAQEAHLPVVGSRLVIDAVAVRRGRAKLYTTVHDMYDGTKVGTAPGLEVTVE